MHTTNQLLDALSAKYGGVSDYRLAKLLNTSTPATVNNWRKGRSGISPQYAVKLADLLGWEPAYVLACVERERTEKDSRILDDTGELKATWEKIAARFAPGGAAVILIAGLLWLGVAPKPANASLSAPAAVLVSVDPSIHYAKYGAWLAGRLRRLWQWHFRKLKRAIISGVHRFESRARYLRSYRQPKTRHDARW